MFQVMRCREVQQKLSLLSQRLRVLLNVCNVYSNRLTKYLSRADREALREEDEDEGDEDGLVSGGSQVLPVLSNEVG